MILALGTEIGIEIEDGLFEKPAETVPIEPVVAGSDDDDTGEDNDFIFPGAGLYASPTNCADYFQCTEDKTVKLYIKLIVLNHLPIASGLHFPLR